MATQIITLNAQGLRNALNRETMVQWLNCFRPEIVCLQETHATSLDEFSGWFANTNYQRVFYWFQSQLWCWNADTSFIQNRTLMARYERSLCMR